LAAQNFQNNKKFAEQIKNLFNERIRLDVLLKLLGEIIQTSRIPISKPLLADRQREIAEIGVLKENFT